MTKLKIAVGMSGGVDSSVTALLLKKAGHEVFGLFMKNWEETDASGRCHAEKDYEDVARVCEKIGIPYYSINFAAAYQERVFNSFLEELKAGHTPNPDILCNKEIKFDLFLKHARALGADFLATGHYAQVGTQADQKSLLKGSDPLKDQSYFLYTLSQEVLNQVLFPIGHLEKKELRKIAREAHLPTADKKDSTGICFIGKRDFKEFLSPYLAYRKGPIKTLEGKTVGEHDGAAYYTIGQRKGLSIGGAGEAWFVVDKDIENNVVLVAQGENHPALFHETLTADQLSWVSGHPPILPWIGSAKIRYRQQDQPCVIESIAGNVAHVRFLAPQRAITQRQAIVFYAGPLCLGGGFILDRK